MTLLFIFILLFIAVWAIIVKHRKTAISAIFLALFSFLIIGNGLLPAILLKRLQAPFVNLSLPEWKNQNAIVLLGVGTIKLPEIDKVVPTITAYGRIEETAFLYLNCLKSHKKCLIIISGGDAVKTSKSEAEIYRDALLNLGINNSAIKLEDRSMNTFQNAEFTSVILKKNKIDETVLVTSGIHLKRALLYFSHFGIAAKPALADYLEAKFSIIPLAYNFAMTDFALHEYLGTVRYYLYNFFGLNNKISSAGVP